MKENRQQEKSESPPKREKVIETSPVVRLLNHLDLKSVRESIAISARKVGYQHH